jgi:hypothetical protein
VDEGEHIERGSSGLPELLVPKNQLHLDTWPAPPGEPGGALHLRRQAGRDPGTHSGKGIRKAARLKQAFILADSESDRADPEAPPVRKIK